MDIIKIIEEGVIAAVDSLYGVVVSSKQVAINTTRTNFVGDYTVVTFAFTKIAKKKPEQIGEEIGKYLMAEVADIEAFNVVKGFLNVSIADTYWKGFLAGIAQDEKYGYWPANGKKVMVEFSSPNTNKPLHLGHIRNILLGWSAYKTLSAAGYDVTRTQIINDRGIAICRSMVAWQKFGEGDTPESTGVKGDHFVGKYYVEFAQQFEKEYLTWQGTPEAKEVYKSTAHETENEENFFKKYKNNYFNKESKLGAEAKEMLLAWEANEPKIRALWKKMNDWVYAGFESTYKNLGVEFDKLYFESDTYLLGKEMIEEAIESGFMNREGKRVWANFDEINLEPKTVLKSDGTSTYTSQDMGTAQLRYDDYGAEKMVYVVADEQNDHFKGLFHILKKLEKPYADGLFHLSYGMIDLTTGKMKSREGTIVDADDLMRKVIAAADENSKERESTLNLTVEEQAEIVQKIGLAALKFFIIKVNPKKRMTFDPAKSVDLHGQTGPYVQNAYVRIQSVLRRVAGEKIADTVGYEKIADLEKQLLVQLFQFPTLILTAAEEFDPSSIANYCYNLAKGYHRFYHEYSILKAESEAAKAFRLQLSQAVANVLKTGMDVLGIEMPAKM